MQKSNYRAFGAFRCLLAIVVVVGHALPFTLGASTFASAIGMGNIAVMGFFVLSGFIITEAGCTFYRGRPVAFIVNRFWRIAPPYWLALGISIGVHYWLKQAESLRFTDQVDAQAGMFGLRNIVSNVFAIFPFQGRTGLVSLTDFYPFVRFYWAIFAEVYFYLCAFGTFVLASLFPRHRALIFTTSVAGFLILHLINDYVRFVQGELTFAPYFLLGACLYGATLGAWPAALAAIPCFIAMALHFIKYTQARMPLGAALDNLWVATVWFPTAMVALLPGVIVVLSRVHASQHFHSVDKWLGDLSYPIYLNHYAVLIVIASSQPSPSWAAMGFALVGTALLSWLASLLVETPLRPIRDRIRREKL